MRGILPGLAYLLLPLGLFDDDEAPDGEPGLLGELLDPDELPEAADDGLLPMLLVPPEPAFGLRLHPASARASEAARMASSFMNPPINVVPRAGASIRPCR